MCAFCGINERKLTEVIILENDIVSVALTLHQKETNLGAVLVIPKMHIRDIYEAPEDILSEVIRVSKQCALAMKRALGCSGITILQNNELAGGQDVFHFHMHVIPRFENDHYFIVNSRVSDFSERNRIGRMIEKELRSEI